jgi:hypothetical protein
VPASLRPLRRLRPGRWDEVPELVCFLLRSVLHFGFLVFLQICRPEFRGDQPHSSGRAGIFGSKDPWKQSSRLKPSYEFHFEGLSSFSSLGPVYTTVEKACGRSRMLGQDMVI